MDFLNETLTSNPYFGAGAGLLGVGAALSLLRQGLLHGTTLAKRRLLVSLEIPSKDQSYSWMLNWMATAQRQSKPHQLAVETSFFKHDNGSSETRFSLVPGPGMHLFRYKKAWFLVSRQRESRMVDLKNGSPWETITLTTLSRDRDLFRCLLEDAKQAALLKEEGKTVIYTSYGPDWRPFGNPRKKRPFNSVILRDGLASHILKDVQTFLGSEKWYMDRGIPYRRGYLLYGPPGTGKTSFIQSLAGSIGYNICVFNLAERGMTDDRLAHLFAHTPPRSILLLEDVDAAFMSRQAQNSREGFQSMVTFSGLLNALDGVASTEERLIFMTTNHVERLDPALIRPGRVDFKALVDNLTPEQSKRMFLRFFEGEEEKADAFAASMHPGVSPAALQGHFVRYRDNVDDAIKAVDELNGSALGSPAHSETATS